MAHRVRPAALVAALLLLASAVRADFVNFESGQVRPLALSPDGSRLYAANTPDNRLEIFSVNAAGLRHVGAVPVGLEPVAVAVRNAGEVWVVNHLSDSVSIVAIDTATPANSRVVRTLLTCDEPRDIVFAGTGNGLSGRDAARRHAQRALLPLRIEPKISCWERGALLQLSWRELWRSSWRQPASCLACQWPICSFP